LPAFTRSLQDPFPPGRIAALMSLGASASLKTLLNLELNPKALKPGRIAVLMSIGAPANLKI
jgi:hypothetical protein